MNGMNEKLVDFFSRRADIRDKLLFPGTFRDYAEDIGRSLTPGTENSILRKKILEEADRLLGNEIPLVGLDDQLRQFPLISCADHHGLLNFSFLYNSNILCSQIIKQLKLPFFVVFSGGNVSMLNISYPRGFYFKRQKFNFFPIGKCKCPVFIFKNKLYAFKDKGLNSFVSSYNHESINKEEEKFLEFLFLDALELEKAGQNYKTFSDQITFLNFKIWKYFFDKKIRAFIPDILYLQLEKIINDIVLDELNKKNSLIYNIIFDPDIRRIYINNFFGIKTCWGDNFGSQLFWGISESNKSISLYVDDSSNLLKGQNFSIAFDRTLIMDAIHNKRITSSVFFVFLIITFMEGYFALGGLNQIEYLPKMQAAHIKSLQEIGMPELAEKFAKPVASGLICGMFPFDFDSAIDMIWHYNSHNGKFNGNLDRGITQEDLDRVLNTPFTDLVATGIDKTLEMM